MKKEKRRIKMQVYLHEHEYNQIINSATLTGFSISTFARNICLGTTVKSREDREARVELRKINADLGRLGGLLKLAITNENRKEIKPLIDDISKIKDKLKEKLSEI